MDGYVAALPALNPTDLGALGYEASLSLSLPSQQTLGLLIDSYSKSQYVKGAWYGPSGADGVKAGIDTIAASLGQTAGTCQYLAGQVDMIAGGLETSLGSLGQLQLLSDYMNQLSASYHSFNEGLASYTQGVDTIASNYATLDYGLSRLASGVRDLKAGTSELSGGTNGLYINVENLPQMIQEQVDEFLEDYQKNDFEPISFVSPMNTQVSLVQFVLLTDAIEIEIPAEAIDATAPVEETFLDKLMALFE
jgi:X-X-X-Leu-X-X-Gly heptad repeat protein